MWKFIIFAVAAFILFKLIMGDRQKKVDKKQQDQKSAVDAGEMAKDPICGTYVSTDSDIRVRDQEQVYYFCSYECRDEFLKQQQAQDA